MGHQLREVDGITVVELSGEFWGGAETRGIRELFKGLVTEGKRRIVVDLGKTSHLNSPAIGTLMSLHTTVSRQGGKIALARITKRIHNVLVVTKLVFIFDTYETLEEAVAAISEWSPAKPADSQ